MGRKNRNTNIKILQRQIQDLAIKNESLKDEEKGEGVPKTIELTRQDKLACPVKVVELETKPKKKGIKKDELINTKRLLTM